MLAGRRILLVEDDGIMGPSIAQRLVLEGAQVEWLTQAVRAIHAVRTPRAPVDAVICDIKLPDGTGEEIYTTLCRTMTPPPFLFITGQGGIDQAVRLMKAGAADYLTKPFDMAVLLGRLGLLIRPREKEEKSKILGISPAAQRIEALIAKAAAHDRPTLISGPPGLGKTLIARRIHALSDASAAPFVQVNLTREKDVKQALYGEAGAFRRVRDGVLLLSAIERLEPGEQDRLVEALARGVDCRLISTAGPGLALAFAEERFRHDLFASLSVAEIPIPALAQRKEDAVWLLNEMFAEMNGRRTSPLRGISSLAEEAARNHDWPDNGRELRNRLRRAFSLAEGDWLLPADLFPERQTAEAFQTLLEVRETAERDQILAALERTEGQVAAAAKLLRISRTTLWEKMQKLDLHLR